MVEGGGSRGRDREDKGKDGKFRQEFKDHEFLGAVKMLGPKVGTSDVAEDVGCDRDTAYKRLKKLRGEGEVESEKIGQSLVWTARETSDEQYLEAVKEAEIASAPVVAEKVGVDEDTAKTRLNELTDRGEVRSTEIDGRPVWFVQTE